MAVLPFLQLAPDCPSSPLVAELISCSMLGTHRPPAAALSPMVKSPALAAGHESGVLRAGAVIAAPMPTHGTLQCWCSKEHSYKIICIFTWIVCWWHWSLDFCSMCSLFSCLATNHCLNSYFPKLYFPNRWEGVARQRVLVPRMCGASTVRNNVLFYSQYLHYILMDRR